MAAQGTFEIKDENNNQTDYTTCFINSNVPHQFKSNEASLVILINPVSCIGYHLYNKYRDVQITSLNPGLKQLQDSFMHYCVNDSEFPELINAITHEPENFKCDHEIENHFADERIYKAIEYLEQCFDRVVPLKEIAGFCYLSETRFLHLFKEKTNLNFRRYQLWNKLIKSLPYLKTHSITETAYQFGFTNHAHYSRTFKVTFGLSPKFCQV